MASPPRSMSLSNPNLSPHPPSLAPEWASDSVPLKDFQFKRQVPGFAKIIKGSYMTLGSSKFSLNKQHTEVFIHSVKVGVKVLAHCVKRVETTSVTRRGSQHILHTTRLYALDQRLAVPISYQGWFELLSEDGKSARPIVGVRELSKAQPDKCLVRENIKAYIISDENKPTFDKTKIVIAGEQLLLNGDLSIPSGREGKKVKLLRCIDTNGDFVYLSFDQMGTFTPIAGDRDFAGVFNIRDIVKRFRLPLTVKLIMGVRPKVDPSRFTGLVRLDWVYTDETAFICPIEKNHVRLLPVPLDANLQCVSATNQQAMKSMELYTTLMAKCSRMINNYNNTLHLIVQVPEAAIKVKKGAANPNVFSAALHQEGLQPKSAKSKHREQRIMTEIDDLYGYVRDGGPPPENVKFSYDSDEESYWEEPAYEPLDEFRARLKALEAGEKVNYHEKYKPQDVNKLIIDTGLVTEGDYGVVYGNAQKSKNLQRPPDPNKPPPLPPRPIDLEVMPTAAVKIADNGSSSGNSGNAEKATFGTPPSQDPTAPPPPVPKSLPTPIPVTSVSGTALSRSASSASSASIVYNRHHAPPNSNNVVTVVSNYGMVSSSQSSIKSHQSPPHTPPLNNIDPNHVTSKLHHSKSSGDVQEKRHRFSLFRSKSSHHSKDSNSNSGGSSSNGRQQHLARDFKDSDLSTTSKGSSSGSSGPRAANIRKKMQTLYL